MTKQEVQQIIHKQQDFFRSGKTLSAGLRIEYLRRLKETVVAYEDAIIEASRKDSGRADVETFFVEINATLDELAYALRNIRSWTKPQSVKTPLWLFRSRSAAYPQPYGNVLIFSAWNFPLSQLIIPLAGAIAAGNTAVLKPSPESPASAGVVAMVIKEVFPPEYAAVCMGGNDVSTLLLEERFDYVFFTGSPRVGRIVMEAAAKHLTPVTLELGGKSPAIIDEDADIDKAAKGIVWAKCYNAGQVCVAVDHVYVHSRLRQQFLDAGIRYCKEFYGDDPLRSPDFSWIINENNFNRAVAYLKEGTVVYGGQVDIRKRLIAPTILTNIPENAKVLQEEVFAPILPVLEFSDISTVIAGLKTKPKPLALYYFSKDPGKQQKIIRETFSGGVTVNDVMAHGSSVYLGFGGVGNSGIGSYHGKKSFDTFTHYKSVLFNQVVYDPPLKYPPYHGKLSKIRNFFKFIRFAEKRG